MWPMAGGRGGEQQSETAPEEAQILNFPNKDVSSAIINTPKGLKEVRRADMEDRKA